jgi:hypothetical protein
MTLFAELAQAKASALEAALRAGRAPRESDLAGFEWRGYNTAPFTALLGIRKFIKGFFMGPRGLEGYNIPARQNPFAEPWKHKPDAEAPTRFGFYLAAHCAANAAYPEALLLDYGASPRNARWRPERVIRDYLVQPFPGDPNVLLGKAYIAVGPWRLSSNYFVLERLRPTTWKP